MAGATSRADSEPRLVLFPFAIVRLSVMPLDHLAPLGMTAAEAKALDETSTADHRLRLARERLLAAIALASRADASHRRQLVDLRRRVARLLPVGALGSLGDSHVAAAVARYSRAQERLGRVEEHAESSFLTAKGRTLAALEQSALEPDFRDSLPILSLPFSLQLLGRAAARSAECSNSRAKRYRLSLFRYLARACVKPSPLAKLVAVGACRLRPGGVLDVSDLLTAPSVACFNDTALGWLLELCLATPELSGGVPVELNRSLREAAGGGYEFLCGRRNVSALQRLPGSAGLREALRVVQARPAWRLGRLRGSLIANGLCEPHDVGALCDRMIEVGLLIPHLPRRRGTDHQRFSALVSHLHRSLRTDLVASIDAMARSIARLRRSLPGLAFAERMALLKEVEGAYRTVAQGAAAAGPEVSIQPSAYDPTEHVVPLRSRPGVSVEQVVFEDRVAPRALTLDERPWPLVAEQLDTLARALLPFSPEALQRERLGATLRRHYREGERIPLLEVVERHLREVDEQAKGPELSPGYHELRGRFHDMIASVGAAEPAAGGATIPAEQLASIGAAALALGARHASCSAFLQTVSSPRDPVAVVLNSLWPGHGKAFGRFLGRLPRAVRAKLRSLNESPGPCGTVAELLDASEHSANSHPPLSRFELALPGASVGCRSRPMPVTLQVRDCFISYDAGARLSLWHAAAPGPLLPSDLGLVGFPGRSKAFQLLSCLGAQDTALLSVLDGSRFGAASRGRPGAAVVQVPRLLLGTSIVVGRRSWLTRADVLRECMVPRSPMQRFRKLASWRRQHGLPRFVFLVQMPAAGERGKGGPGRRQKPQFLDWESPLTLDVVEGIPPEVDLCFSEMLPDGDSALASARGRHAFELILTWYAKGQGAAPQTVSSQPEEVS